MSTSSIPAAIDGLLTLLRAQVDAGTQVVDGFPRFTIADTDLIAVGGKPSPTADGSQTAAVLGGRRRDENYTLHVTCSSSRGGDDQKGVRDRVFALLAVVENTVRNNLTLGGAVNTAQVEGGITLSQTDAESAEFGVFAEVTFEIAVWNRI